MNELTPEEHEIVRQALIAIAVDKLADIVPWLQMITPNERSYMPVLGDPMVVGVGHTVGLMFPDEANERFYAFGPLDKQRVGMRHAILAGRKAIFAPFN